MQERIIAMWGIQDSLLQSYRNMAITLMGLISAGILVSVARVGETWAQMSCLPTAFANLDWTMFYANLVLYGMLIVLLGLGWLTSQRFKMITAQRGAFVTYFQNLLIAEEQGALEPICDRHGIAYPPDLMSLSRRLSNPDFIPLTFEDATRNTGWEAFHNEINQVGGQNAEESTRHDPARAFLSTWIYKVFNWFFALSSAFLGFALLNLLC